MIEENVVSTHSRPKAAAMQARDCRSSGGFNTQPPEGGCISKILYLINFNVSTHSRPKAAEFLTKFKGERGEFQHTAARRRLVV